MILLLAGPIAAGKTTVASSLAGRTGVQVLRVREELAARLGVNTRDRSTMQAAGRAPDTETQGRWLADSIAARNPGAAGVIVDSLRTPLQARPILERFDGSVLIYLDADERTRRSRYQLGAVADPMKASADFSAALAHETETLVRSLEPLARLSVDTSNLSVDQVVDRILKEAS